MKRPGKCVEHKRLTVFVVKDVIIFCISEFLLHKAKPDLTLVDVNNNTALHLACSKVTHTYTCMYLYACSDTITFACV